MEKEDLEYLYEKRCRFLYDSLSEEDKKQFDNFCAEKTVEKWRANNTLIRRFLNFSQEDKNRYAQFLNEEEVIEAALQAHIIKAVIDLHYKKHIKNDITSMDAKKKQYSISFLEKEINKDCTEKYKKEIELILSWLKNQPKQ